MINIAILITCHNRKDKTLSCIKALYENDLLEGHMFDVFLVDDGSSDGTSDGVMRYFPEVNIIKGSGELYWNKGMKLAWDTAVRTSNFDYFIWLNDDAILEKHAIKELLDLNQEILNSGQKAAIICGACKSSVDSELFSYGGKTSDGPVIPNGQIQECKYINGNAVLIPRIIFEQLGTLSPEYTHILGDYDYGLRAIKQGFKCYTTKTYIAVCPTNPEIPAWCNPSTPLKKRWKLLHSPKGLNIREYKIFCKSHYGWEWIIYALKAYLKVLSPGLYFKFTSK